jgi:CRP-like cAMP-binding protein
VKNQENPMKSKNQAQVTNELLAGLPNKEYQNLLAGLEPIYLNLGEVLYEPGDLVRHIYFPFDCLVSLLAVAEDNVALEVGLVGREGMVGIPVALGVGISPVRAMVQRSGTALHISAVGFRRKFRQCLSLQRDLYRYANSLMMQVTQIAVCSRFHMLEARLARALLMTRDREQSREFHLTHEFLAHTLGVRRVGITNAASALQEQGLISYSRGDIKILDGPGLEAVSCQCYKIVKDMEGSMHLPVLSHHFTEKSPPLPYRSR